MRFLISQAVYLKWFGNFLAACSAIAMNISPTATSTPWPFLGFLVTHLLFALLYFKKEIRDWAIVSQNLFFMFLDVYGVLVRIGYLPGI